MRHEGCGRATNASPTIRFTHPRHDPYPYPQVVYGVSFHYQATVKHNAGCGCAHSRKPWVERHDEFKQRMSLSEMECMVPLGTWKKEVKDENYKPEMRCTHHPENVIKSLSIANLYLKGKRGCPSCNPGMVPWSARYPTVVVSVRETHLQHFGGWMAYFH